MDRPRRSVLHPLLLERGYWRNRLAELKLARPSLLIVPRPDLSGALVEIEEFRAKGHDGTRLWGLKGRCLVGPRDRGLRIRQVGPCEVPEIDPTALGGAVEYVLQAAAGRRLEERVLDLLRLRQIAAAHEGVAPERVSFAGPGGRLEADELRIARQLVQDLGC
jgi:hypothetical protein